ncbi:hypothetical protein Y032_0019g3934 [Ancylostoma ceylanicum]|uniref:BPTI/Kunitz inhibitor domain-containing protein n=1 Tax=Ancylostoma ceylanicum TaxID=53326 RepID=A0A016V304_9BILA|nr:hypothetical protein Y032_0019g3934 [Ancylostoma ceylanicum]
MLLILLLIAASHAQEQLSNPRCNLMMDRGTCVQFTIQWYYDRWDHRCRRFHYGGCEGNENRFSTLEECSAACNYSPPSNRDRCFQPHDPGDCDNDIERWFFDMNKKQCVCSWWTGCGGNSNLFYSYNHCMFFCGEYAEHGPGIDEKYWGSKNRSSMSQASLAIFSQSGSTYPAQSQQQFVDRSQSYQQVGQSQQQYPDRSQSYHQAAQHQQNYPDRSQYDHQVAQPQQTYQDRSQSYHQVAQPQQTYQDRSQPYHQATQHQQNYPDRSQYDHQVAQQQQTYQDRSQSYHQTAQPQQDYSDRSQSYHQTAQQQQTYQDRSQSYHQTAQPQQDYSDRSQSYHQTAQPQQNYQDRSQSYHQTAQPQQDYSDRSQSYHQVAQSQQQNYQDRSQSYHQEQIARDNFEQALRRESDDQQSRYQQFNTPNGQTVIITRNGPGYRDQRVEHHEWRQNAQPSSRFSEFRSSTSHSSTSHSHFHHSDSSHGFYHRTGWFNSTSPRARGERIYRYDSGPVTKTHPNGTITINRQTIYIAENRQPRMRLVQHLPGLVEFTRITPPPPFLTMIPPAVRRKLKKLKKMKVPPRVINPVPTQPASFARVRNETSYRWSQSTARMRNETSQRWSQSTARVHYETSGSWNHSTGRTRNETVPHQANNYATRYRNQTGSNRRPQHANRKQQAVNRNVASQGTTENRSRPQRPTMAPPTRPPTSAQPIVPHGHQHDNSRRIQQQIQSIPSTAPTRIQEVTPPPTRQPSPTQPQQIRQVEVQNVILDAGRIFQSSPLPTSRVEAEPIEITRPIVTSVPVTKVDFDEVLALESQYDDDYEEPADEPLEPEEGTVESTTERPTSTSTTETSMTFPSSGTTLAPIVLPPPDYNANSYDDRSANVIPGDTAQPVALVPPPRSPEPETTEESTEEAEKRLNVLPPTPAPTIIIIQSKPSPWTPIVLPAEDQTSSTQMTVGEDYTENVEFDIQTVGVDG